MYCYKLLLELILLCPIGFGLLCFSCHLSLGIFFFFSFLLSSVIHWLFSNILFSLHMFGFFKVFFFLCISHSVMVKNDVWYDFNFLKFTEDWLMAQDVLCLGECSMCTWEVSVFCTFQMECSKISIKSILSNMSFKACVSLVIFYLDDLSIGVSVVLKPPLLLCSCWFLLLWMLAFALYNKVLLCWVHIYIWLISSS